MDQTPDKYAYRCLPLTIGNTTGWDIYPVCNFYIAWSNVNYNHQTSLSVHPEEEDLNFGSSSFGSGIVTFHPGYLFRTEKNWDLLVTGTPNEFIDFAYPLTGIVETYWNDFTFTMNWKMMKFGSFFWPKEVPICRIIPIPHDYGEMDATIVPLQKEKDLLEKFKKNSRRRKQLINDLHTAHNELRDEGTVKLKVPSTHWEKAYYRGLDADGNKEKDHVIKREFPEFKKEK